jgi:hypothetical protein
VRGLRRSASLVSENAEALPSSTDLAGAREAAIDTLCRAGATGRIPAEVDEQPEDRQDENRDDPEHLSARAEIAPSEDTHGDQNSDEDPGDER